MEGLITTSEIDYIFEHFDTTKIEDVGKRKWFKKAEGLFKIYQVAAVEAAQKKEERVIKACVLFNKCEFLIREIITISVWKEKILPELLNVSPKPEHSFPTYVILYNEMVILGILQCLLFHSEMFDYVGDLAVDLVDYAVLCVAKLNNYHSSINSMDEIKRMNLDPIEELKEQNVLINFTVGSNCLVILRYVCENFDKLPLSVATRMYTTHDVPILITHLLDCEIWSKKTENKYYKFNDNGWKEWLEDDPVLSKTECQVWLLLRQILINKTCDTVYYYSSYRKEQLAKLTRLLHDRVIDQLSPLADLKVWLNTLLITSPRTNEAHRNPLIIEITPDIRENLLNKYEGQWKAIALKRAELLFYAQKDDIKNLAQSFANCFDLIEEVVENVQTCVFCFNRAFKRCSKCKKCWYCSRKCQVQHWPAHKKICE